MVAGLGNIYVCEALHRARLSPKRRASTIATKSGAPHERAQRLVDAVKAVLNDAIRAGGSSLRDHRRTDGALGDFQHNFRVYDRDGRRCPTPGCGGTIRRIVQTGRSTFFLPGLPALMEFGAAAPGPSGSLLSFRRGGDDRSAYAPARRDHPARP